MSEPRDGKTRRNEQSPGPVVQFSLNSFRRLFVALAAIRSVLAKRDFDDAKKVEIIRQYVAAAIGFEDVK